MSVFLGGLRRSWRRILFLFAFPGHHMYFTDICWMDSSIHPTIHLFLQLIFIEHLLDARHCFSCWKYAVNKTKSLFLQSWYISERRQVIKKEINRKYFRWCEVLGRELKTGHVTQNVWVSTFIGWPERASLTGTLEAEIWMNYPCQGQGKEHSRQKGEITKALG